MGDMRDLIDAVLSEGLRRIDQAKADAVLRVEALEEVAKAAKTKLEMALEAGKISTIALAAGAPVTLFGVSEVKTSDVLKKGDDTVILKIGSHGMWTEVSLVGTQGILEKVPGRVKAMVFLFPA